MVKRFFFTASGGQLALLQVPPDTRVRVMVDGWGLGSSRRILIDATRMSLCENTDMI
jgi:hypothetical protein